MKKSAAWRIFHVLFPMVKFDLSQARELKPIIDPENKVPKINIENEVTIFTEEDEEIVSED